MSINISRQNLMSTSKLSKIQSQFNIDNAFAFTCVTYVSDFASVLKLSCRAYNSRRECDYSPRSRQRSRRRFEYILYNSVYFIFDNCSLYVFRTCLFSRATVIYDFIYISTKIKQLQSRTKHRMFQLTVSLFFCLPM